MTNSIPEQVNGTDQTALIARSGAPTGGEIYRLISQVMREVGSIPKSRKTNDGPRYDFRGIDDLYNAFQPALASAGVFVTPLLLAQNRVERESKTGTVLTYTTVTVECRFYAPDGSSVACVTLGEAMDSSDKSSSKAMTAAMKAALIQVFCLATDGDNDPQNRTHEPVYRGKGENRQRPDDRRSSSPAPTAVGSVPSPVNGDTLPTVVESSGAELDPAAFDLSQERQFTRLWLAYCSQKGLGATEARTLLAIWLREKASGAGFTGPVVATRRKLLCEVVRLTDAELGRWLQREKFTGPALAV
ncbi:MAG: ERF family protein [Tepidisphaeraceae bacterium]